MNVREWALPVYTILMQLATGALLMLWIIRSAGRRWFGDAATPPIVGRLLMVLFVTTAIAIGGAHFHLSKPLMSFLAIRNFPTSWLSREIVFTILFFNGLGLLVLMQVLSIRRPRVYTALGWITIGCGLLSVLCMGYIYLMPTQPAWNSPLTILSFYATMLLLGVAALAALLLMDLKFAEVRVPDSVAPRSGATGRLVVWLAVAVLLLAAVVLAVNLAQLDRLRGAPLTEISLELLLSIYRPLLWLRVGFLAVGVAWLMGATGMLVWRRKPAGALVVPVYIACLSILVGEILARFLLYAAHVRVGL